MLKVIKAALKAAGKNDVRYHLNGIHCVDGRVEATNGTIAMQVIDVLSFKDDIIICRASIERFIKIATPKSDVKLTYGRGGAAIIIDELVHKLELINGRFPDVNRVTPTTRHIESPVSAKGFNNKLVMTAFNIMHTLGEATSTFNVADADGASVLSSGNATVLLMPARI